MKIKLCTISLLLALGLSAQAAIYTFNGTPTDNGAGPGVIPDNNTVGLAESQTLSGLDPNISSVILSITLQGGVATDLSGLLRLGNDPSTSPFYNLTSAVQSQNLAGGSPITFNVDVTSSFTSSNPNNTWTLFFADTVEGDQTTLNGWSLNISNDAVPEPVNMALGIFGGVIGVVGAARSLKKAKTLKAQGEV